MDDATVAVMERRRFLRGLGMVGVAPLLSACAHAFHISFDAMTRVQPGPKDERDPDGVWREGAAYARWTPSPHNIQPWRLRLVSASHCELLYDPARLLPKTDPTSAFTIIGLTMFVEYLSIAVRPRGYTIRAEYVAAPLDFTATVPKLFARLELIPATDGDVVDRRLILERKTSRLPYDGHPVDEHTMQTLAELSRANGHQLRWSSEEEMVKWTIDLNRFTLFQDLNDDVSRTELRQWIRPSDEEAATKQDGLWSHCLRFPGWLLKAFFDQHEKWGRGWRASMCGKMLVKGMHGTRTVAWWSGPFSLPEHWIQAGVVLARSWLELTRRGVQMHPFGSIITNPSAHARLLDKLGTDDGAEPLWLLVRVGHSDAPPRSYRLDASAIFLDDHSLR